MELTPLEGRLNAPDPGARRQALQDLLAASSAAPPSRPRPGVNLHCHTIYSYNGYGYSPTALAWLAHREGW